MFTFLGTVSSFSFEFLRSFWGHFEIIVSMVWSFLFSCVSVSWWRYSIRRKHIYFSSIPLYLSFLYSLAISDCFNFWLVDFICIKMAILSNLFRLIIKSALRSPIFAVFVIKKKCYSLIRNLKKIKTKIKSKSKHINTKKYGIVVKVYEFNIVDRDEVNYILNDTIEKEIKRTKHGFYMTIFTSSTIFSSKWMIK